MFDDAEVFEGASGEKEIVVTEMDASMFHSQEKGRKKLTVKLGVMYSGKELESETVKYKRYPLTDKTLYGGIEEPEEFGEKLYLKGEEKLPLSKARNLLWLRVPTLWLPTSRIGAPRCQLRGKPKLLACLLISAVSKLEPS